MKNRIYPIRITRKKWYISFFSYHQCNNRCNYIDNNNRKKEKPICSCINNIEKTHISIIDENWNNIYNINQTVIPDNFFSITIYFPLSCVLDIQINSPTSNGFTLKELLEHIKRIYLYIYKKEEQTATPETYQIKNECIKCKYKDDYKGYLNEIIVDEEQTCVICFEKYFENNVGYKLICGHIYHKECINGWFKNCGTCPICREKIVKCNECDGSGYVYKYFSGIVIPKNQRGIGTHRNLTNGIYGIHSYDIDDLKINCFFYNRITKKLEINIIV